MAIKKTTILCADVSERNPKIWAGRHFNVHKNRKGVYASGNGGVPETRYYQDAVLQEYACLMLGNING